LIAAVSIFVMPHHLHQTRFVSSPPAASDSVSTRGVICHATRLTCLFTSRTRFPGRHDKFSK
jgi:hypothetical protein